MSKFKTYLEAVQIPGRDLQKLIESFGFKFTRKPVKPGDIGKESKLEIDLLEPEDQDKLVDKFQTLKMFEPKELWESGTIKFMNDFKISVPSFFLLDSGNTIYLINTEGYNYARYVLEIPDFKSFV